MNEINEPRYSHTVWTPEEIATWDDPEPTPPKLELVVNNGRSNID